MIKFYTEIDYNDRQALIDFLSGHFRYNTMNSWNNSISYANNVKLYNLDLPKETRDTAWEMLEMREFWNEVDNLIRDWDKASDYCWQAGFNGRNSGYLVLYQGGWKDSGHKSYCLECGQLNYRTIEEIGTRCGKCGNDARVNLSNPTKSVYTYIGRDTDQNVDFTEWDLNELRDRVELVQSFDKLCGDILEVLVAYCQNFRIEEEKILVPRKIKVLKEVG